MIDAKRLIKKGIGLLLKIMCVVIPSKKGNQTEIIGTELCKISERKYKNYMSFRIIPQDTSSIPNITYKIKKNLWIVLQGPLRADDDFSFNTVVYYKKMYPDAHVIVSTWDDEDEIEIHRIEEAGAEVLTSRRPEFGGHLNINYQLISSYVGIKYAYENGAQYICKTRTDQRLAKPHVIETIINLIELFPPSEKYNQKGRIAVASMNYGNLFFPYFMSDFFYLGESEDMIKVFDGSLDDREPFTMPQNSPLKEYSNQHYQPEITILCEYLTRIGFDCSISVKKYWEAIKECMVCVDFKFLDLLWPKYDNKYKLNIYYGDFFFDDSHSRLKTANFDFINWINLISGTLEYEDKYEQYSEVEFL